MSIHTALVFPSHQEEAETSVTGLKFVLSDLRTALNEIIVEFDTFLSDSFNLNQHKPEYFLMK